jgi:hypothetical protein
VIDIAALLQDTAKTVEELNAKVREALTMGKPSETYEYANALSSACSGIRDLASARRDLDDDG